MEAAELRNGGAANQDNRRAEGHEIGSEAKRLRHCQGKEDKDGDQEYMDEDEVDWAAGINFLDSYRDEWIRMYGKTRGSFEDETQIPAMRYTVGPILPISTWPIDMLQIFSLKVMEITGGFQWPLGVYGHVAARDSLDQKRNYLFRRQRENCQTLTSPHDLSLKLTGPSRAVVLMDPVYFEVHLKVKSSGTPFECEDKVLSYHCFCYNGIVNMSNTGFARREVERTEHSSMEFAIAHLKHAVEATIEVRIVEGSADFKARFTARTTGIDEDVVLLDSLDTKVTVAGDGLVALDRHVVSVEEEGKVEVDEKGFLSVHVEATEVGGGVGDNVVKKVNLLPRVALRSQLFVVLGFCKSSVVVAWSMLS